MGHPCTFAHFDGELLKPLSPHGHIGPKDHAGGSRLRNYSSILVGNRALGITDRSASLQHRAFGPKLRMRDGAKEVYLQFDRRERFALPQGACKSDSHSRVRNVAEDPAVKRAHGIGVLWAG
jgi:hypothetical protein